MAFRTSCRPVPLREIDPENVYARYKFVGTGPSSSVAHLERFADMLINRWAERAGRFISLLPERRYFP